MVKEKTQLAKLNQYTPGWQEPNLNDCFSSCDNSFVIKEIHSCRTTPWFTLHAILYSKSHEMYIKENFEEICKVLPKFKISLEWWLNPFNCHKRWFCLYCSFQILLYIYSSCSCLKTMPSSVSLSSPVRYMYPSACRT